MTANSSETSQRPEPLEMSGSLRRVVQRNSLETTRFDSRIRQLDQQKRTTQARLSREQRELEEQLERLQEEQRLLVEGDDRPGGEAALCLPGEHDSLTTSYAALTISPADVINPYPVTIRSRNSPKRTPSDSGDAAPSRLFSSSPDYGFSTSRGKLPPLQRTSSRGHLVSDSRTSINMSRTPSSSSLSLSARSCVSSVSEEAWLGDPEAISSVRRPRRTRLKLRLDQTFSRSHSLKERAGAGGKSGLTRSHSLRGSVGSLDSASRGSSPLSCSQMSGSLADTPCQLVRSIDCMSEGLVGVDITAKSRRTRSLKIRRPSRGGQTAVLARHASTSSLGDYAGSPETRSSVWTTESTPEPPVESSPTRFSTHRRRANLQVMLPGSTFLPTPPTSPNPSLLSPNTPLTAPPYSLGALRVQSSTVFPDGPSRRHFFSPATSTAPKPEA